MRIYRATLRGKPLDDDCYKAERSTHEYGSNDNRVYCYGLFAPNGSEEIHPKCEECGAYCRNAKPLQMGE